MLLTGTPEGVGPINAGDKITAGLLAGDETLSSLDLDVIDRQGGFVFEAS